MRSHLPCPDCGSSDALTDYGNATHCFSCGAHHHVGPRNTDMEQKKVSDRKYDYPDEGNYRAIPERGISAKTAEAYKVRRFEMADGSVHIVYPRFNKEGHRVAEKVRVITKDDPKKFFVQGNFKDATLFGQQLFAPGGKFVTITEGQDDAMAAYELMGSRYPVVSVDSAESARKDCVASFEYLNSFDGIVINFDTDAPKTRPDGSSYYPGQEAAEKVAALFPIGKVKILQLRREKDANQYLLKGLGKEYVEEWWKATPYIPSGIKLGREMWEEIVTPRKFETVLYPWGSANEMTYGMRLSEVVLVTADTGIGKTSIAKEIEYHVLKNTTHGVGFLHLEEPNVDTALGLMSIEANKPLHLPDVRKTVDDDELRKLYDAVINNDRVVVWDHFGSNSVDEVLNKIRHMVALGCRYIFLDHLTIVVSDHADDERKQLDEISTKLKMICMELNVAILAIIHQNRQGQIRGSAGPEQIANIVIKASRNKEDDDPWRRNVTKLVCQKNRFCGKTGPMTYLFYNDMTGRLQELTKEEARIYENGGSPNKPTEEKWL